MSLAVAFLYLLQQSWNLPPPLGFENLPHAWHIPIPGPVVENGPSRRAVRDERHQVGSIVDIDVIVEEDLVSPTCDSDELAVSNFLVLDPTLCGLFCTLASAGYNIDVSKFLDPPYFVRDSRLGWWNLFPIYPSLVEEPVKIVFGDRESLPRRPAVQILHLQLCPKLPVGSVTPDEHRLCQDPIQVDSNL